MQEFGLSAKAVTSQFTNNIVAFKDGKADLRFQASVVDDINKF